MRSPPGGSFRGLSDESRDEKVRLLYSVINDYVGYSVSAVVHLEPLKRIIGNSEFGFPKQAANPYYHAISSLISSVARLQIIQGMPADEKVDWVFDERFMEQGKFLSVWDAVVRDAPPDVRPMIGGTPIFKADNDVLPLQAADLEAWWLRRRWDEKLKNLRRLEYPWRPEPIPECNSILDEKALKTILDRMVQKRLELVIFGLA
jgi:hypothetical protein